MVRYAKQKPAQHMSKSQLTSCHSDIAQNLSNGDQQKKSHPKGEGGKSASSTDSTKSDGTALTLVVPRWLYCYTPIIVGILAVLVGHLTSSYLRYSLEVALLDKSDTAGWDVVDLFVSFDKNGDYHLSFEEAESLLIQIVNQSKGKSSTLNPDIVHGEEVVTINARFIPLNISTMTKDFVHDVTNNQSFEGLFKWTEPHITTKEFGVSRFQALLPDGHDQYIPAPGTVYSIVDAPNGFLGYSQLSSNRYYPPLSVGKASAVQHLLSMFHPQAFVTMRFPPQGIYGCVRALSQTHVEVVFRMHPEFQLNEPPKLPFWYTPAQFTGSLTMTRNGSTVEHFHLYVPPHRRLNVDMEWMTVADKLESMEVDIGHMALMELTSAAANQSSSLEQEGGQEKAQKNISWDQEITMKEATDALERKFYPFKEVTYYNLSDAFAEAQSQSKLVHSILLWGALDDQSC